MKTISISLMLTVFFSVLLLAACSRPPGQPDPKSETLAPGQLVDFNVLYGQNCAGCHGTGGKGGAALSLANPIFLGIADDSVIRRAAAGGVSGTPMPAFAQSAGGMLTDEQIESLVHGIRAWARPDALADAAPPPYSGQAAGDLDRGKAAYATFCSACHGPDGKGSKKASSIVEGAFLALVSDQELRTIVIAGRPDLGSPDWRGDVPGRPMSAQDVSDVVAWLAAQRPQFPGQPYATAAGPGTGETR